MNPLPMQANLLWLQLGLLIAALAGGSKGSVPSISGILATVDIHRATFTNVWFQAQ